MQNCISLRINTRECSKYSLTSKQATMTHIKPVAQYTRMNSSHVYDPSLLTDRTFMIKYREYQYQNYRQDDESEWSTGYYEFSRMRMIEEFAKCSDMNYDKVPASTVINNVLKSIKELSIINTNKAPINVRTENVRSKYDSCVVSLRNIEIHHLIDMYTGTYSDVPKTVIHGIEEMCKKKIGLLVKDEFFTTCVLASVFTRVAMVFVDTSSRINYHHSGKEWRRLFEMALRPFRYYDPQFYIIIEDTITNGFEVPYQITTKYRETNKICFIDRYNSWQQQDWSNEGIYCVESDRWFDYDCMHAVEMRYICEDSSVINSRNTLNDQSILEIINRYGLEVMRQTKLTNARLQLILVSDDNMLNDFADVKNRIVHQCKRAEPIISIPARVDFKEFKSWQIDNIHYLSTRGNLKNLQVERHGKLLK